MDMTSMDEVDVVPDGTGDGGVTPNDHAQCRVCGAVLSMGTRHKHEAPGWKPRYDDLEGALEGYGIEANR